MRVKVSDVTGTDADLFEDGQRLAEVISPALEKGEAVVLDFEGVQHFMVGYFASAIGPLILKDAEKRLPELLRYENLSALGQNCVESVTDHWTQRRDVPGYAQGWDEDARKYSQQWRE